MTDAAATPPSEATPPLEPESQAPEAPDTEASEPEAQPAPPEASEPEAADSAPEASDAKAQAPDSEMPDYKGEPLDAERGPGLGCFWIQIGLLTFFLIFTPLTVTWGWPPLISGALLIFTLILLLFSGQTIIFLLRLVAVDRRARRTPLDPSAKPTVGQIEDAGMEATKHETTAEPTAEADDEDADG